MQIGVFLRGGTHFYLALAGGQNPHANTIANWGGSSCPKMHELTPAKSVVVPREGQTTAVSAFNCGKKADVGLENFIPSTESLAKLEETGNTAF